MRIISLNKYILHYIKLRVIAIMFSKVKSYELWFKQIIAVFKPKFLTARC